MPYYPPAAAAGGGTPDDNSVTSAKIVDGAVANADLANMVQSTVKGRAAGAGTGVPGDLTATQATALLNNATGSLPGLMTAADFTKLGTFPSASAYGRVSGSDFTRTVNSLADITGLTFSVAANEVWAFFCFLSLLSPSASGVQIGINGPSGAGVEGGFVTANSGVTSPSIRRVQNLNTASAALVTAAISAPLFFAGVMTVSSTPGTLSIQGQPLTNTETLTVRQGSFVLGWKLA